MRPSTSGLCTKTLIALTVFTLLAGVASAGVNGAIYTTTINGSTVDGNIYASKGDVYLSGGPQNTNDPGLVPDGFYYFQVTDPSGAVLLSTDDVTCRVVYVYMGRVAGIPGTGGSDPAAGGYGNPACYHMNGTQNDANGALPVQLCSAAGQGGCPGALPGPGQSYYDTPNPGGEYKAWMTPVGYYSPSGTDNCSQPSSHMTYGFCDSDSKTDNFKVRKAGTAAVRICKFDDVPNTGIFDSTQDPLIPGWPITATGVDSGSPTATGSDGCADYTVSNFTSGSATLTFTEGTLDPTIWAQTAPANGTCTLSGTFNAADTCTVTGAGASTPPTSGGAFTVTVSPNDIVVVPYFGNTPTLQQPPLQVSKTALGSNMFNWTIAKNVNKTEIDDTTGTATFNYTVTVTHDAGTGWAVAGVISVFNPGSAEVTGVTVSDGTDNGTVCPVSDGTNVTIPAGTTVQFNYTCMFTTNPGSGVNTATAMSVNGSVSGTANFDFTAADTTTTVTDSLAGNLGTVSINADNSTSCLIATSGFASNGSNLSCTPGTSTTFTYSLTFSGDPAGTCTNHNNTASFTTNTNSTATNSNTVSVKQCVGEDVKVSKNATATFSSGISKSVNQTKVEQSGGNITFNYTVDLTSPSFGVTGTITVNNPNDWESVTVNVTDLIDNGGTCVVTGGAGVVIAASGSTGALPYSCTYTANPTLSSGTNTAYASVTAGITPDATVSGTAPYSFNTLTITDNLQSSAHPSDCLATLGTASVTTTTPSTSPGCGVTSLTSPSWGVFKFSITDANSNPGTCSSYNDTASTGGSSSGPVTVTVCNIGTGALTMGFWKNTNGAKIIDAGGSTGGACNSGAFLRMFNPFMDLSATATCKQVASYVSTVIGAANCSSGGTCNLMLKAQMLATALDVFFSTPGLGGNQIGAYNGLGSKTPALGGVAIDLSHMCSMTDGSTGSTCTGTYEDARYEFGIVTTGGCLGTTVLQMLGYSNYLSGVNGSPNGSAVSNSGGSKWYNQVKTPKQVYAKDGFDNTNNAIANIAPPGGVCSPTF